jgi:hypothetical protein
LCKYLGELQISKVMQRLRKEAAGIVLTTSPPLDELETIDADNVIEHELEREQMTLTSLYELKVCTPALANVSPGRYYMTVPMCSVCCAIYSAMDTARTYHLSEKSDRDNVSSTRHGSSLRSDSIVLDMLKRKKEANAKPSLYRRSAEKIIKSGSLLFTASSLLIAGNHAKKAFKYVSNEIAGVSPCDVVETSSHTRNKLNRAIDFTRIADIGSDSNILTSQDRSDASELEEDMDRENTRVTLKNLSAFSFDAHKAPSFKIGRSNDASTDDAFAMLGAVLTNSKAGTKHLNSREKY